MPECAAHDCAKCYCVKGSERSPLQAAGISQLWRGVKPTNKRRIASELEREKNLEQSLVVYQFEFCFAPFGTFVHGQGRLMSGNSRRRRCVRLSRGRADLTGEARHDDKRFGPSPYTNDRSCHPARLARLLHCRPRQPALLRTRHGRDLVRTGVIWESR
jgi:hypothetical protein